MDLPPCTVGSAHHWRRSASSGSSTDSGSPSSSYYDWGDQVAWAWIDKDIPGRA